MKKEEVLTRKIGSEHSSFTSCGFANIMEAVALEICFQLTCEMNGDGYNFYDRELFLHDCHYYYQLHGLFYDDNDAEFIQHNTFHGPFFEKRYLRQKIEKIIGYGDKRMTRDRVVVCPEYKDFTQVFSVSLVCYKKYNAEKARAAGHYIMNIDIAEQFRKDFVGYKFPTGKHTKRYKKGVGIIG